MPKKKDCVSNRKKKRESDRSKKQLLRQKLSVKLKRSRRD